MCRTDIVRFATIQGVDTPSGGSPFETITVATIGVLQCSQSEALEYAAQRLVSTTNDQRYADHLSNMDAAIEVVDSQDRLGVVDSQNAAIHEQESIQMFSEEMATDRQQVGTTKRGLHLQNQRYLMSWSKKTARLYIPQRRASGRPTLAANGGAIVSLTKEFGNHLKLRVSKRHATK